MLTITKHGKKIKVVGISNLDELPNDERVSIQYKNNGEGWQSFRTVIRWKVMKKLFNEGPFRFDYYAILTEKVDFPIPITLEYRWLRSNGERKMPYPTLEQLDEHIEFNGDIRLNS